MLDRIVSLTCDMLDASCQPKERAQRQGTYAGPLWDYKIPGTREIIPFIRDFAKAGASVRVALNDRHVATLKLNGEATVANGAMAVPYHRQVLSGGLESAVQLVPTGVHPKSDSLLSRKPTRFGAAVVTLGSIIPRVSWENDHAVFRWDRPAEVQTKETGPLGLIDWNVEAAIKEVRIGEFTGRIVFSRPIVTFLAPDLEWA